MEKISFTESKELSRQFNYRRDVIRYLKDKYGADIQIDRTYLSEADGITEADISEYVLIIDKENFNQMQIYFHKHKTALIPADKNHWRNSRQRLAIETDGRVVLRG